MGWYEDFREKLKKVEAKSAPKVRKLLRANYQRVASAYSHDKTPEEIASKFLNQEDVFNLFRQIYRDVYISMGTWSGKRQLKQKTLLDDLLEYLSAEAVTRADIESLLKRDLFLSTNRDVIIRFITRIRENPEFLELHEQGAARFLMKEFRELSKFQSRRIIRTEATNAANRANLDTAQRLFPGQVFEKQWVSAKDGRTRDSHRRANGQKTSIGGQFFVGGELLPHPGAGSKAENNIFCRCAVIPVRNG